MIEFILTLVVLAPFSMQVIADDFTKQECKDTGAAWVESMPKRLGYEVYTYTCSPMIRYQPTVNVRLEV